MIAINETFAYIGQQEILLIAGIALLLFGGAKLPELAKGLGQGIREFKNAMNHETPTETPTPNTIVAEPTVPVNTEPRTEAR